MKKAPAVLAAILGMAGGAWAQSLLEEPVPGATPGSSPYDPPRAPSFKKHDAIEVLVQWRPTDVAFGIAAEVADVRPNGTLVLQAIRTQVMNGEEQSIRLTAEVAPQSIAANKVHSDKLMNMKIAVVGGAETTSETATPARKVDVRRRSGTMP